MTSLQALPTIYAVVSHAEDSRPRRRLGVPKPQSGSIPFDTMPDHAAKLSFWGVRGSTPSMDRATCRYGGNTPCLELVTPDGGRFILDCGTGFRMLGNSGAYAGKDGEGSEPQIEADIFVTHYHWDHIQGIPFFAPLYSPRNKFRFYSFRSEFVGDDSLKRVFETQMARPYFPVNFGDMSAAREFTQITGGDQFALRDTRITVRALNHPQGCLGFRFETPAGVIVYATDNEPGVPEFDAALVKLAEGADIFINDAQYTPEQLETRKGWGHSSWLAGVGTAKAAGVRHLVLFHHDPDSSDKDLDNMLRDARRQFENVWMAAEGMVMTLGERSMEIALRAEQGHPSEEANSRICVSGWTREGRPFEEQAIIGEVRLQGATLNLKHRPKLQSTLRVVIDNPAAKGRTQQVLQACVVRVDPHGGDEPTKEPASVDIEFID